MAKKRTKSESPPPKDETVMDDAAGDPIQADNGETLDDLSAGDGTEEDPQQDEDDFSVSRDSFWSKDILCKPVPGKYGRHRKRYVVEQLLGKGGGGWVYLGHDTHLDRAIAIKVMPPGKSNAGRQARFISEAEIVAKLDHPNIVPVYDLDITHDGTLYLAMKNIRGRPLGDLIRQGAGSKTRPPELADPTWIATTFLSICDALSFAHNRKVIHQDVKPDNIMIGEYGEVLLIDWGTATSTPIRGVKGTPLFMSPEQARSGPVDERTDVYGLGSTLFQVLTLRGTLKERSKDAFWEKKRKGMIDPVSRAERYAVSPRLIAIALKALQPEPADRYPSIQAMAADLRQFLAGQAISVVKDSLLDRTLRFYRKHTLLVRSAALLLLISGLYLVHLNRANTARLEAELKARKEVEARTAHWHLLAEQDFRSPGPLQSGFQLDGWADHDKRPLLLRHRSPISKVVWKDQDAGQVKLVIEFNCSGPPSLYITASNKSTTNENGFIRNLFLGREIWLEKTADSFSPFQLVYTSWERLDTLHKTGLTNRLEFWCSGRTWYADYNGHRILTHYDSFPNVTEEGIRFEVGRIFETGDLQIETIRILQLHPAAYIPALEPGRALHRNGENAAAQAWFERQARFNPDRQMAREAEFLAASIGEGLTPEEQLARLTRVADNPDHPFRDKARHDCVFLLLQLSRYQEALQSILVLCREAPSLNTFNLAWPQFIEHVNALEKPEKLKILRQVAALPIQALSLHTVRIDDVSFLEQSRLLRLQINNCPVKDLTPLRGMPLSDLNCAETKIADLSPLEGMPLKYLAINGTQVSDLSALRGMTLDRLLAMRCGNGLDLSTLQDTRVATLVLDHSPLSNTGGITATGANKLRISGCELTNLDFLQGMSPYFVNANDNRIVDISGLNGLTLNMLLLDNNRIEDLSVFRNCRIRHTLSLSGNPVSDLSPLEGQEIRHLDLDNTRVQDLSVLLTLPNLHTLSIDGLDLDEDARAILTRLKHVKVD